MKTQVITACAFIHKDGKLFVAKRADTKRFLPGVWELPGGHIEYGEDIKVGLERELKEEFGIDVVVGGTIHAFTYINKSKNTHSIEVDFLVEMTDEKQNITLNQKDHSEYRFVTEKEALELWTEKDPEREAVVKGFEILKCGRPGFAFPGVAVGAMIFNSKGEIFITKRGKKVKNERGTWEIPGGSVEFGETLENAIKREIKEELGAEVEIMDKMVAQDHVIPNEKQHWVPTTFICRFKEGQIPKIMEPDKCDAIGWFDIEALPSPLSIITKIDINQFKMLKQKRV